MTDQEPDHDANRSIPDNVKRWVESMSEADRKKVGDALILKVFVYKDKSAMVVVEIDKDKRYNTRMLVNKYGRWFNIGGGGFFDGKSEEDVVKMCENLFQREVKRWDAEKPEEIWKTPDQVGYTHLVVFEPVEPFEPKNDKELLDALNEHLFKRNDILTGYFRTKTNENEKLVGRLCTTNPTRLREVIQSTPNLKLVKISLLDKKMFEEHTGQKVVESAVEAGRPPKVVKFEPALEAKNIEPESVTEIRVTFDQDMSRGGYSWCGGPPLFPETTDKPRWIDKRTCVLPVKLEEKRLYRLAINGHSAQNFKSEDGVPATITPYFFSTKGYVAVEPKIVKMEPENGSKDVDANEVKELRITFDIDMSMAGFSWCGGGETFPETTNKPRWIDKRTCVLPVKLAPGKTYQLSINAPSFKNFRSVDGVSVEPVPYSFSTKE